MYDPLRNRTYREVVQELGYGNDDLVQHGLPIPFATRQASYRKLQAGGAVLARQQVEQRATTTSPLQAKTAASFKPYRRRRGPDWDCPGSVDTENAFA